MHFFLPRQLVFLEDDGQQKYYKVRFHWDGGLSLSQQNNLILNRPFVLLLDPALPFRRKFQFSIQQRVKREFILASAAGLFPFALDDYACSLGAKDSESYLFALKNSDYEVMIANVGQPAAALVSDANESAMISALKSWMDNRSVYALHNIFFPVDPAKLLSGVLITFLLLVLVLGWIAWADYFQLNEELIQEQASQITNKAKPLLHKRMVVSHMQSVSKAVDKLSESSRGMLLKRLIAIMDALPADCYVENIQLEDGRIEVNGWGAIPAAWFVEHGISDKNFQLVDLPKEDRFKFWIAEE